MQFSFLFKAKNLRQKKQFCGTNHKTVGEKVENRRRFFCKCFTDQMSYPWSVRTLQK